MVIPNFVRQALAGAADHRLRRRHADAQLHLRRRRRRARCCGWWTSRARSARCSTSATTEEISIMALAEKVRDAHRQPVADRARCRTTRPTRPASRTCRAACPTSRKIQRAGRLRADSAISTRSSTRRDRPLARTADERAALTLRRKRSIGARRAALRAQRQARQAAAARDGPRPRAACPTSSRSRAPTSATPSACSARATRCSGARASWTWSCSGRSSTSASSSASRTCAMHNYGEPFVDRAARREGALRQAEGHRRRSA